MNPRTELFGNSFQERLVHQFREPNSILLQMMNASQDGIPRAMVFLLLTSFMTYNKNCPKSAGNNMCSLLARGNGNNTCRNSKARRETCMWFQHACFTVPRAVGVLLLTSFMTYKSAGEQYVLFTCARQREQCFQKFKNAT